MATNKNKNKNVCVVSAAAFVILLDVIVNSSSKSVTDDAVTVAAVALAALWLSAGLVWFVVQRRSTKTGRVHRRLHAVLGDGEDINAFDSVHTVNQNTMVPPPTTTKTIMSMSAAATGSTSSVHSYISLPGIIKESSRNNNNNNVNDASTSTVHSRSSTPPQPPHAIIIDDGDDDEENSRSIVMDDVSDAVVAASEARTMFYLALSATFSITFPLVSGGAWGFCTLAWLVPALQESLTYNTSNKKLRTIIYIVPILSACTGSAGLFVARAGYISVWQSPPSSWHPIVEALLCFASVLFTLHVHRAEGVEEINNPPPTASPSSHCQRRRERRIASKDYSTSTLTSSVSGVPTMMSSSGLIEIHRPPSDLSRPLPSSMRAQQWFDVESRNTCPSTPFSMTDDRRFSTSDGVTMMQTSPMLVEMNYDFGEDSEGSAQASNVSPRASTIREKRINHQRQKQQQQQQQQQQ
eukprot:PhM_4_TR13339/c5_g1_i1/m.17535